MLGGGEVEGGRVEIGEGRQRGEKVAVAER